MGTDGKPWYRQQDGHYIRYSNRIKSWFLIDPTGRRLYKVKETEPSKTGYESPMVDWDNTKPPRLSDLCRDGDRLWSSYKRWKKCLNEKTSPFYMYLRF